MFTNNKGEITSTQIAAIVAKSMIGTGILILPREIAKSTDSPDGWISVILGGLITLCAGYIVMKLNLMFPKQTIFQYGNTIVGKYLGIFNSLIVIAYFTISAGYLLRVLGEVIRMYLLVETPIEVTMIAFSSVAVYLTLGGIQPIARFIEFFFPLIIVILIALIALSFREFEVDNIRPVLGNGGYPVLKGIVPSALSYSGYQIMLILAAYAKAPEKAVKLALTGICIVIILYTMVVIVSIGTLTVEEVKTVTWPTMSVAKDIDLPGGFFERFESMFSVLWVISMYTAFVPYHFVASLGLGELFHKNYQSFAYLLLPFIYIFATYPKDLNAVFRLGNFVAYYSIFTMVVIPLCLWIIARMRRIGT
ncbi:spore germination protein [Paenibacillus sp. UNCCL117]|uniref:GerAB/ArcD/ProY family transporter n=1 Tax=unclassified Paenibacillus TaxID=185978 RepID=UPI0008849261|nr:MULTISPECIES: GerAB/ArcD/ProY family transporter [unclassified Paenibacillus]SDC55785.1 spore germination protein [Paenibacillus sp. cl123]SFW10892.1 spore germination protein [Paenibacillus sp. UNCCL117]